MPDAVEIRSDTDGIDSKLPGAIKVNPNNGQVTVFDDLPQQPIKSVRFSFDTGAASKEGKRSRALVEMRARHSLTGFGARGRCIDCSHRSPGPTGVGSDPFWVTKGRVYLTGPYRGAPYGLAVVVDAIAGPFNLGTVIVRQAIHVDPRTAEISVMSDPFPTILKGVPAHIREVRVSIDKPHFMVAPTNCSRQQVRGTATSVNGSRAPLGDRFQVGNCRSLKFSPRLSLTVGSRHHTSRGISTPFRAVLTQKPGQSNLRSVKVVLPQTLAALLNVVNHACSLSDYENNRCDGSKAGTAVARTPLLKDPLTGGVFFVRHPGRPLPDLMVRLRGELAIDLVGRVTIPGGTRLATNFDTIPDAPVSKFTLNIVSGRQGPLGISTNLCTRRGKRSRALVQMHGQNGDTLTRHPRLHIHGCSGGARHRH